MAIANKLEEIVESISDLPPFQGTAMRIMEAANDPSANANDIIEVVQYDQAVTANCLRLCNSAYFGLRTKPSSIKQALVLIGNDNLVKIVLANCCKIPAFYASHSGYGYQSGELWRHSVACALLSQLLQNKTGQKNNSDSFVSSLLHDIGKLVIDAFIADDFEAIYALMKEDGFGFVEAEKEYYGIDHAEVGGMIAEAWNFPAVLVNSIRNHHMVFGPASAACHEAWASLSNQVSHLANMYFEKPQLSGFNASQLNLDILSCFGLTCQDIEAAVYDLPLEMKKAEELLKV